ncbi:unnamed protein product [Didymodactylos carnosus]|uniref:Uncharacterized protein n=1 Tax=Didymodactylos carnosus TaxID=1234261 RepID=A0A815B629_9BILA|nr:unnamed protein product [Didymodactylos carnosus]CAF4055819.1 unnamed protein product [Didymodactylos carnosus]
MLDIVKTMAFWDLSDTQRAGAGLVGFAFFFILLGFTLFFDRALLALGNILLVVGLILLLTIDRAKTFFTQPDRYKASLCFFSGIILLLLRWPIVGVILEIVGFYKLFGGFIPLIINVMKSIPGFGLILSLPYISNVVNRLENLSKGPSPPGHKSISLSLSGKPKPIPRSWLPLTKQLKLDNYDIREYDPKQIANELTLINQRLLLKIKPDELFDFRFVSTDKVP